MKYLALRQWVIPDEPLGLPSRDRDPEKGYCELRGQGDSQVDLTRIGKYLSEVAQAGAKSKHGQRVKTDVQVAVQLWRTLRISRRIACDRAFWGYLHVTEAWPYMRWRWGSKEGVPEDRLFGGERSGLGRLWWIAELVRPENGQDRLWRKRVEFVVGNADRISQLYGRPMLLTHGHLLDAIQAQTVRAKLGETQFRVLIERVGEGLAGSCVAKMSAEEVKMAIKRWVNEASAVAHRKAKGGRRKG